MISSKQRYNFCTIFDYNYFAKGLALYYSLDKVCDCHLYVFTSDEKCKKVLTEKQFPNLTVIEISEIENKELLAVKAKRDIAEYFWTIKGPCLEYLFSKYKLDIVTYIDADSFFYSSPAPILNEMADNSVLILPHNFSQKYKHEIKNGIYNAGFISFRNDNNGLTALKWWKDKSIEWCYKKKENGKFGDQMYLNEMANFPGVHNINHMGGLANWNVQQYRLIKEDGRVFGLTDTNEKFEVIFYHFHYMKFLYPNEVELGRKFISDKVLELFYKPYIKYLLEIAPFKSQGAGKNTFSWKTPIIYLMRKMQNTYNIFSIESLNLKDVK
jgi:hypothetical protein